jgi:protein-S-isoprenylcysteine O-methyltransferase Ste14
VARTLSRIYPFAVALWTLALAFFAQPFEPRSVVGGAFVLSGLALAAWAAGYNRKVETAARGEADGNLYAGPYGWVRNPSQLGTTLAALGLTLWSGALWPWLPVATAVLLVSYSTVVQRAADVEAERRLGWDYRTYRATVPVWFPRFVPRPRLAEGRWRPGPALRGSGPLICGVVSVAAASLLWTSAGGVRLLR